MCRTNEISAGPNETKRVRDLRALSSDVRDASTSEQSNRFVYQVSTVFAQITYGTVRPAVWEKNSNGSDSNTQLVINVSLHFRPTAIPLINERLISTG